MSPVLATDLRRKSELTNQATVFLERYLYVIKNLCRQLIMVSAHIMAHFSNMAEKEIRTTVRTIFIGTHDGDVHQVNNNFLLIENGI